MGRQPGFLAKRSEITAAWVGKVAFSLLLPLLLAASAPCFAQGSTKGGSTHLSHDALLNGFRVPPLVAEPRVWWHWMNGNITKRGIRLDLEWMKRIGIGGVECIDASIDTPQIVQKRLVYMTPGWKDAFRYAVNLANKLGMEFAISSSPGWSETGGPWVPPEQAMKKLVWSTTQVTGGKPFHGVLPKPPDNPGPFQNAKIASDSAPSPNVSALKFYRDSVVIAYKAPVESPQVTKAVWNGGAIEPALLSDGDLTDGVTLVPQAGDPDVWVRLAFAKLAKVQGLSLAVSVTKGLGFATAVEVSDDGTTWRHVADFPKAAQLQRMVLAQQTISFPPVVGRFFRVVLRPAPPLPTSLRPNAPAPGAIVAAAPRLDDLLRIYRLHELVFHAAATVGEFEKKAGFAAPPRDFYSIASSPQFAPGTAINPNDVVVLTDRMKPDGRLDWTPPPGHWTVLRMGYSLTGAENHPAPEEATGLEVDKLNRQDVRAYMEHYLTSYERIIGPRLFGKHGVRAIEVDSSEVGMQNWTDSMLADFKQLRGYDPRPWLPALTGVAVQSPMASDKFLWDFRHTIEELFARNHYGEIAAIAREHGLINYGEALEDHRPAFGDDMEMRQYTNIPMGAMWTYGERYPSALTYEADILGAASIAHIYGQNLVAAESLTSAGQPWAFAPRELKPFIDMEFARGVNRVVIHTSVHQPVDRPPGLSLFGYGQFFDRLESWADEAGPWIKYIARSSYLLQQGNYVADVAYFYGQEAPITGLFGDKRVKAVPPGYAFDFVDSNALEHELSVRGSNLVTKSGMRYRVLYLGGSSQMMTLSVLRRLRELVGQGAILVGRRPFASPSLRDTPSEFQAEANSLFGDADAPRNYGKGKVFPSGSLADAFLALHLPPDFEYSKPNTEILYLHRRLKQGDLYFVSNRQDAPETITPIFRIAGYVPEVWDAVTGKTSDANFAITDGRTRVTLTLPAYGSAFVVFRKKTDATSRSTGAATITVLKTLRGPWKITFQPHRGAPANIIQNNLESWSASEIRGVKYFSGTGVYTKAFELPQSAPKPGARLMLDLGDVRELAVVSLNDKPLGTVWTPPFQVDITKAAKPGKNVLTIKVTNLWVNRLIGDAQPDTKKKYTFTIIPTYRSDAPLRLSGLLGPVLIRQVAAPKGSPF
ncbi:MAG: glycoside hydrolase [Alphaproteobacteria bacterium]|nr:glycoside hydrolase [Alphaproteobacteria bacterium]